jgi:glycosyltransferase involved in cell wall biosynthesis
VPAVSIIVPMYKVEAYLGRCLDSILAQTFEDFEVLCVSDDSPDGSLAIAEEYACKDTRIRTYTNQHSGLGLTRNYGLERAGGSYILFVDSDDWLAPDLLEKTVYAARTHDLDIVFFDYAREYVDEGISIPVPPLALDANGADPNALACLFNPALIGSAVGSSPFQGASMLSAVWRRLWRADLIASKELRFYSEERVLLEDKPFTLRAHLSARRVGYLSEPLYHYRYNSGSLSFRYREDMFDKLKELYWVSQGILEEFGIEDEVRLRHEAWFARFAVHSSLVNCMMPANPLAPNERNREARRILSDPLTRSCARNGYFDQGGHKDRTIIWIIGSAPVSIAVSFYRFYAKRLLNAGSTSR